MVLSTARDARAEYWRMLAITQPIVIEGGSAIDPHALSPLWHKICREAGSSFPRHYLGIGIMGLRRLPAQSAGDDASWLPGLAEWALAQNPSAKEFLAEWLPLKALYPRAPERWRKLVANLLSAPLFKRAQIEAPAWWGANSNFAPAKGWAPKATQPLRSPLPEDADRVIAQLDQGLAGALPQIEALLNGHRRYLEATGDPEFFVRAVHVVGEALIKETGKDRAEFARKAQSIAIEGLAWAPNNHYLWALWGRALFAVREYEAAELVFWDAVRRLPWAAELRTQLATVLAGAGKKGEAEELLRETVAMAPGNTVVRNQLATVLAEGGKKGEAEELLRETVAMAPGNTVVRNQLATVLAEGGKKGEAEELLRETMAMAPRDIVARNQLATVLAEAGKKSEAEELLRETMAMAPGDTVARDQLATVLAGQGKKSEAEELLRETMAMAPGNTAVRDQLAKVLTKQGKMDKAEELLRETKTIENDGTRQQIETDRDTQATGALSTALRYGALRRLSFQLAHHQSAGSSASEEVRRILAEEPSFAYAQLLAMRQGIWQSQENSLPAFAVAFEQAISASDRNKLEELAKHYPRLNALILVAKALLGDPEAERFVETWIRGEQEPGTEAAVFALRKSLHELLSATNAQQSEPSIFRAAKATVLKVLTAANEITVGPDLLVA